MELETILEQLKKTGLSQNEANIYILFFKLGTQPISIIAKKLNIPRSTGGFIAEELYKKGLLSKSKKGNMFLYSISSINSLLIFLENQKQQKINALNKQINTAKNIIPTLQSLQLQRKSQSHPKITFYEGIDGIKKVYEDTLTSSETLRSFAHVNSMHEGIPNYFPEYYTRRAKRNIHIRSVHPDSPETQKLVKRNKEELRDALILPSDTFTFTPEIQFYDGKINIVSWKEKLGIIIESKEIYEVFIAMFELAFEQAKKYNK